MTNTTSYQLSDFSVSYSPLTCPYTNLAIENHLIEGNFEGPSHLLVYRNDPCIVMGRFQVPWREINIPQFLQLDRPLQLVRRRSGGGTVYHDLGNWNFCFIHKKRELARKANLSLMIDLLASVGIQVTTNERHDLVYHQSETGDIFKVSGSAFKQKRTTSLHHGTLLMNASLKSLKGCLGHPDHWQLTGKGVASFPSPVINLGQYLPRTLEFSQWIDAIEIFFNHKAQMWCEKSLPAKIQAEKRELAAWNWLWGETPAFNVKIPLVGKDNLVFSLEGLKGRCMEAQMSTEKSLIYKFRSLIGCQLGAPLASTHLFNLNDELESFGADITDEINRVLAAFFF